jgi:hypothetical protein
MNRPTYTITLRPEPCCPDPIRALRADIEAAFATITCAQSVFANKMIPMISLSDSQLRAVMTVAADVPQEKRGLFLERLSAMLMLRGRGRYTEDDLIEIAKLARTGLAQQPAA